MYCVIYLRNFFINGSLQVALLSDNGKREDQKKAIISRSKK